MSHVGSGVKVTWYLTVAVEEGAQGSLSVSVVSTSGGQNAGRGARGRRIRLFNSRLFRLALDQTGKAPVTPCDVKPY